MTKSKTVVIDFPWNVKANFKDIKKEPGHSVPEEMPYKTMTDLEIQNFPINDYADNNCDLFLWVTQTKLPLGLKLMELWGFKYHCTITWYKKVGYTMLGFHRNTELCLYGYRGRMGIKRNGKAISTMIIELSQRHSQKPDEFYNLVATHTEEPRCDIFARKQHPGFIAYGDQVEVLVN